MTLRPLLFRRTPELSAFDINVDVGSRNFRELGVGIEQSEAKAQERMRTSLYGTLGDQRADELRARGATSPVDELVDALATISR